MLWRLGLLIPLDTYTYTYEYIRTVLGSVPIFNLFQILQSHMLSTICNVQGLRLRFGWLW